MEVVFLGGGEAAVTVAAARALSTVGTVGVAGRRGIVGRLHRVLFTRPLLPHTAGTVTSACSGVTRPCQTLLKIHCRWCGHGTGQTVCVGDVIGVLRGGAVGDRRRGVPLRDCMSTRVKTSCSCANCKHTVRPYMYGDWPGKRLAHGFSCLAAVPLERSGTCPPCFLQTKPLSEWPIGAVVPFVKGRKKKK